jgi:putative membrane protein
MAFPLLSRARGYGKVSAYAAGARDDGGPRTLIRRIPMKNSTLFCALVFGSISLVGCSKQGSSPEAENAYTAQTETTTVEATRDPMAPNTPSDPTYQPAPIAGGTTVDAPAGGPPPASSEPVALSDAQIVKVAETVDKGEIEQAKEAQKKSKNPQVKKLASHMIAQHTKSQKKGATLAKKAQLTPEDSPVASELSTKAEEALQTLKTAAPAELDKAYVDAQVKQHETVLELLNTRLIPSAVNADLKAQLEETRSMVEKHIEEARKIQQALTDSASATPPAG